MYSEPINYVSPDQIVMKLHFGFELAEPIEDRIQMFSIDPPKVAAYSTSSSATYSANSGSGQAKNLQSRSKWSVSVP